MEDSKSVEGLGAVVTVPVGIPELDAPAAPVEVDVPVYLALLGTVVLGFCSVVSGSKAVGAGSMLRLDRLYHHRMNATMHRKVIPPMTPPEQPI